jgi:hypothetical protein
MLRHLFGVVAVAILATYALLPSPQRGTTYYWFD